MPACCKTSERAYLIKLDRSRGLQIWWFGLHALVAGSLLMTNFMVGLAALPLLAAHVWCRSPAWSGLMVISPGPRFALPDEGRFDLELGARTQCGQWWVLLDFVGSGRRRVLVLCDQLDRHSWRLLRLTVIDSA